MTSREPAEIFVVFARIEDVEAWYECPGVYVPDPEDEGKPWRRAVLVAPSCGRRAPWDDPGWVTDEVGDKHCPCGAEPPLYPVGCNYVITCRCEQDGCNASDCVESVARGHGCPLCGSSAATLRAVDRAKVDPRARPAS